MKKKILICLACTLALIGILSKVYLQNDEVDKAIAEAENATINEINTYEMSEEEVQELATTEIVEQTEEQENAQEQEVESEGFELQGEIAYEGDRARTWNAELGDYKALVYYSQLDRKMVQ